MIKKILRIVVGITLSALVAALVLWAIPLVFTYQVALAAAFVFAAAAITLSTIWVIGRVIDFFYWLYSDE